MIPRAAILLVCSLAVSLDAVPAGFYQRNIPVEVLYENGAVQVVPREVQAKRNLDAKVQLNSEELKLAGRAQNVQQGENDQVSKLKDDEAVSPLKELVVVEEVKAPQVQIVEDAPAVKSLIPSVDDGLQGKAVVRPGQQAIDKVLQESHEIIRNGLKNLRESFKPGKDEFSPSSEQWATLEKAVDHYFDEEKQKLLKQTSPAGGAEAAPAAPAAPEQANWIQNIVNGFNGIATNFVQSIQNIGGQNGGAPPQGEAADEGASPQPPSTGFQGFIQFFNNGISNIVSTISGTTNNGPTTSNINLSDSGVSPAPSGPVGFFGAIVTNVQNALGIQQQPGQQPAGAQGDTGVPIQQQQNGPVQVIQSVGNAISNFFTGGNQNRPPNAPADEGASPAAPSNTNIIQNIQNAIQNSPLNPFRPQGGANNPNPVQNVIQTVETQAQQIAPALPANGSKKPAVEAVNQPAPAVEVQPEKPVNENEISKNQGKSLAI